MAGEKKKERPRYQLRQAAGCFWILDMQQEGVPFHRPVVVNEAGAEIWRLSAQGKSQEEIAVLLSERYKEDVEKVRRDVKQFQETLRECGIVTPKESGWVRSDEG